MTVKNLKPKHCTKCGNEYQPTNGKQKMCVSCSPNIGGYDKQKRREHYTSKPKARTNIDLRVEILGGLNDEHRDLVKRGDAAGLRALAEKYMQLNYPCTVMAKAIRMQAAQLEHTQ